MTTETRIDPDPTDPDDTPGKILISWHPSREHPKATGSGGSRRACRGALEFKRVLCTV